MNHESALNNIRKMDTETLWSLLASYKRMGDHITAEQLSASQVVVKELRGRIGQRKS